MDDQGHKVTVDNVLDQRGQIYGSFDDHARLQTLLMVEFDKVDNKSGQRVNLVQREAIRMVFNKITRIANGDVNHEDNWIDIAGYAQLGLEATIKNKGG